MQNFLTNRPLDCAGRSLRLQATNIFAFVNNKLIAVRFKFYGRYYFDLWRHAFIYAIAFIRQVQHAKHNEYYQRKAVIEMFQEPTLAQCSMTALSNATVSIILLIRVEHIIVAIRLSWKEKHSCSLY